MILCGAALIMIWTSWMAGPDEWDLALKAGFSAMLAAAWPAHCVLTRLRVVRLTWAPHLFELASQLGRGGSAAFRAGVEARVGELPSVFERRAVLILSENLGFRGDGDSAQVAHVGAEIQAMAQLVRERTAEALHYRSMTVAITADIAHIASRLARVGSADDHTKGALNDAVSSLQALCTLDRAA
jgi:hypothetical protein